MKTEKKEKRQEVFGSDQNLAAYVHYLYKYIGRPLLKKKKFKEFFQKNIYNEKYETLLKKANLNILPEEYFLSIHLTIIWIFVLGIILSIVFLFINALYSVILFYGSIVAVIFVGIAMYNYPIVVSKSRGKEIDAAIPYLLPYLKILSKEISLAKIIEIIDDFLIYKEMRIEFQKIKYFSNFLGLDINSSIREAMISCPSRELSDMMNDLVTISNSGGNIYDYLNRKLDNLNAEIDAKEKQTIETLLIYSQIYVVILLIAPLFFAIMSAILNLVNFGTDSGVSASSGSTIYVIILLLVVLPFLYAGFMMLVYYSKPLYTTLRPDKDGIEE